MNRCIAFAGAWLLVGSTAAQGIAITGQVVETSSTLGSDKPLPAVVVEIRDANLKRVGQTTTMADGTFRITFDDKSALKGDETIVIKAAGYSANPTIEKISLQDVGDNAAVFQGKFPLTNIKMIRENPSYRTAVVTTSVMARSEPSQEQYSRRLLGSLSTLSDDVKNPTFADIKAQSEGTYKDLMVLDKSLKEQRGVWTAMERAGKL